MGFFIHHGDSGRMPPIELMPCGAITPKHGMALTMLNGVLVTATDAAEPTYISMRESHAAVESGYYLPVIRVGGDLVFEATVDGGVSKLKLGDKLTISADGMGLDTTLGGAAEVVGINEQAGTALVRFVRPDAPTDSTDSTTGTNKEGE